MYIGAPLGLSLSGVPHALMYSFIVIVLDGALSSNVSAYGISAVLTVVSPYLATNLSFCHASRKVQFLTAPRKIVGTFLSMILISSSRDGMPKTSCKSQRDGIETELVPSLPQPPLSLSSGGEL
eukprot:CAMPEP_0195533538 /NCGR_PEP_ID=MMETSP0794_2-20130614/40688_1 /TAXON_ID=515487 /ORGANISM="Stephanopyxis turris, Strain CCMP 815" /LENGTH=123 /DNA_ID=CAMNT_0040666101 /DNA_START=324 /DNA_END=695 /DNA_ORIENTATION=-